MNQEFIFLNNKNIEIFYEIFSSNFKEDSYENNIDIESFKKQLEYLSIKENNSFFLKDNNKIIGFLLGAIRRDICYISSVIVLKEFRNKGYGEILLEKGLILFEENNCKIIKLEVLQDNSNAINLYLKKGFKITNEIINYRNENNSFYSSKKLSDYEVTNSTDFSYHFLFNSFQKKNQSWQKSLITNMSRLNCNESELFIIKAHSIIKGYMLITIKNNKLFINDIGINNNENNLFSFFLSNVLNNYIKNYNSNNFNVKIVQANSFYINEPICRIFEENGFFIENKQYEMEKEI